MLKRLMELLNRLLTLMPVTGRVDVRCHFSTPWRIDNPASDQWEIPYHVLLRGEAIAEDGHGRSSTMGPGDIALFPARGAHWLHDGSGKRPRKATEEEANGMMIATNGGKGETSEILCGRFFLPAVPQQLLLDHLPPMLIVSSLGNAREHPHERAASFAATRLARLIDLMREETLEQPAGSVAVVNQLSGALFALTLRFASEADEPPRGLLALAQRPRLQPALAAMFDEPGKSWTLPELAARCHMSRATFIRHFEEAIGRSPADLLLEIRMTLAGRKLTHTHLSVAEIGEQVGYRSDAAFQRAFKRQVGATPAQWRAESRANLESLNSA